MDSPKWNPTTPPTTTGKFHQLQHNSVQLLHYCLHFCLRAWNWNNDGPDLVWLLLLRQWTAEMVIKFKGLKMGMSAEYKFVEDHQQQRWGQRNCAKHHVHLFCKQQPRPNLLPKFIRSTQFLKKRVLSSTTTGAAVHHPPQTTLLHNTRPHNLDSLDLYSSISFYLYTCSSCYGHGYQGLIAAA